MIVVRVAFCAALVLASTAGRAAPLAPVSPMSATQFREAVAAETRPIVVLFYADWAGPSQPLRSALARAAVEYRGKARFVELNVDRTGEAAAQYDIRGVPTLLLLDHGRSVNSRSGATSEEELRSWLDAGLDAVSGSPPTEQ
jgi:thioredoxin 2